MKTRRTPIVALDISGETGRFNGSAWAADRIVSSGRVYPGEEEEEVVEETGERDGEIGVEIQDESKSRREIADPTAVRG